MKKMPLKKLFHIDREDYKSEYEKRFNDDDTVHLDIEISGNAAFLCQTKEMFGSIGNNVSVGTPFLCDYGCNIHIGDNVSVNMNCSFIDCNKITIGSHVLIASNVQIYTATHPIELSERLTPGWTPDQAAYFCRTYALPVTIEDGCWIGGGVIILPGVTIGKGCVIGAGSVVTKNIPADSLAVGNPCRVIREINKK